MAQFTKIPSCFVVVAIDEKFNDEHGPWSEAWIYDPQGNELLVVGGPYEDLEPGIRANCTAEQREAAAKAYAYGPCKNVNRVNGRATFVGCVVVLKGSRKAPNKVQVDVLDYRPGGYNPQYMRHDPEQVKVRWGDQTAWVSTGCVHEVVRGRYPWWR